MNVANLPRKSATAAAKLRPLTSESRVIRGNVIGAQIDGRSLPRPFAFFTPAF
jgi:hypothetical protein